MYDAKSRLAIYRKRASESKHDSYKDWRNCRYDNRAGWKKTAQNYTISDGKVYADNFSCYGVKLDDSSELVSLRYTRWYVDHYQSEVMRGAVVKLRHAKGIDYIAATYCTGWDGITLFLDSSIRVFKTENPEEHENAIRQVARWANSEAERQAEQEREYAAKDQAERDIDDYRQEIAETREEVRELAQAIRDERAKNWDINPIICRELIKAIREKREYVRDRVLNIKDLKRNFWIAVEGF